MWDEEIGLKNGLIQFSSADSPGITALMGSVVAGAGVNPADQRWGFWPLLPLGRLLLLAQCNRSEGLVPELSLILCNWAE